MFFVVLILFPDLGQEILICPVDTMIRRLYI